MAHGRPHRIVHVAVDTPIFLEATGDMDGERHPDSDRQGGNRGRYRAKGNAGGEHEAVGPQYDQRHRGNGEQAQEPSPRLEEEADHEHQGGHGDRYEE